MSTASKTTKRLAKSSMAPAASDNPMFAGLSLLHKRLGVAYGIQALAVLFITFGLAAGLPVYLGFLAGDTTGQLGWFNLSLIQLLALPLAISGTFHIMQAHFLRTVYESSLKAGESPYRWLENAFSASMLPVAIGLLAGMRDATALLMLFVLGFVTHLLAWQYERQLAAGQHQESRRSFAILAVCSLTVWITVGAYVTTTAVQATLPAYVGLAYGVALLFLAVFGWLLLQQGRGRWTEYATAERLWMLLGFVAKSLIVWILFIGAF